MSERAQHLNFALLAELSERNGDMLKEMKELVELDPKLSMKEMRMLYKAFKLKITKCRRELQLLSEFIDQQTCDDMTEFEKNEVDIAKRYRLKIMRELHRICEDVFVVVDSKVLPHVTNFEGKIESHKTIADFARYMVPICLGKNKERILKKAQTNYEIANEMAKELPICNLIRMNLVLNYSVFLHGLTDLKDKARELLHSHYTKANLCAHNQTIDNYKAICAVLHLMYGNMRHWQRQKRERELQLAALKAAEELQEDTQTMTEVQVADIKEDTEIESDLSSCSK